MSADGRMILSEEDGQVAAHLSDKLVEAMPWLDGVAGAMKRAFNPILGPNGPQPVQDALYGTWLRHPLHPAVVELPIGFWTATLVLDLANEERAADLSLKLGLLSAVGAAATGAAQWQDATGLPKARRIGALHALLNVGAAALYAASWGLRAQGSRQAGIGVATAGYAVLNASAWLGGDLSYDLGIGVSRTAFEEPPTDWITVLPEAELPENTPKRVDAKGVPVMLVRQGDDVFAISATCTHLGGPLNEGSLDGETITCPWHGSTFCVRDGRVLHGPATIDEPAFEVRRQNGQIAVRVQAT